MKIFLAAVESYKEQVKKTGYQNLFLSFYTTRNAINTIKLMNGKRNVIVDSGAHSFYSQRTTGSASIVKGRTDTRTDVKNVDTYVKEYCEFIKKWRDKVDYFVELDIDKLIGMKKLLEIRKKIYNVTGRKLMVCYHPTMGPWKENRKELFKYDYIGLEGIHSGKKAKFSYMECIRDCYENKKKVHAFAMTKKKFLERYPLYSTDSTSWQSIFRWGRSVTKREKGKMAIFYRHKMRLGRNNIQDELTKETNRWEKLENYLSRLWELRDINWERRVKYV